MNYLVVSDALINHIKAQVPQFNDVLDVGELAAVKKLTIRDPSCLVVFDGEEVVTSAAINHAQIKQRWLVVVATHHAQAAVRSKQQAGELLDTLNKLLVGFKPHAQFTPLKRANCPRPGFLDTHAFYPLAFETTFNVIGSASC